MKWDDGLNTSQKGTSGPVLEKCRAEENTVAPNGTNLVLIVVALSISASNMDPASCNESADLLDHHCRPPPNQGQYVSPNDSCKIGLVVWTRSIHLWLTEYSVHEVFNPNHERYPETLVYSTWTLAIASKLPSPLTHALQCPYLQGPAERGQP